MMMLCCIADSAIDIQLPKKFLMAYAGKGNVLVDLSGVRLTDCTM